MVMRGSNDANPKLPGHKWYSVSPDEGLTWTPPKPWRYSDGNPFFSPSSISQLLTHSNGKYYWIGNLCTENPRGNSPRYPLVIGEVDPRSLLLVKDSIVVVDTRQADDRPSVSLSNFTVHEDRATQELILHMTRQFKEEDGTLSGNAYLYRLEPKGRGL
jgi:hypothetical protein